MPFYEVLTRAVTQFNDPGSFGGLGLTREDEGGGEAGEEERRKKYKKSKVQKEE